MCTNKTVSTDPSDTDHLTLMLWLGLSEAQVRRTLAEEEEEQVRLGQKTSLHDVSLPSFLTIGLELEEQQ